MTEPSSIQRPVRCSVMAICLALVGVLLCSPAPSRAQMSNGGTIRVASKEVLIPVLVLDKQRVAELRHMKRSYYWRRINSGDLHFLEGLAIRGLSASDFTVLQDGHQQHLDRIIPEEQKAPPVISDNLGKYREFVGTGGGTWAIALWERDWRGKSVYELPALWGYEIEFTPPPSPDGSCHRLQVTVNRLSALVFARSEYCDASLKAADPLQGTILGKRIESDLTNDDKRGQLALDAEAIPLLADDDTDRVRIILHYVSKPTVGSCTAPPQNIGIIGTFLASTGDEVLRFSDETARTDWGDPTLGQIWEKLVGRFPTYRCSFAAPFRYETQVGLPPDKYRLKIGLVDGRKFGQAEVTVVVPTHHNEQLGVSGIALARRFRDLRMEPPESPSTVTPREFHEIPMKPTESPIALPQNYAPLISDGAEITPTANPSFERSDPFCYFFQIYEPSWLGQPQPKVEAHLRIVDATTGSVVRQVKPIDAASYAQPGNPLIPIGGRLDLSDLPTGAYELQAKATHSTGASTQWRTVAFSVE